MTVRDALHNVAGVVKGAADALLDGADRRLAAELVRGGVLKPTDPAYLGNVFKVANPDADITEYDYVSATHDRTFSGLWDKAVRANQGWIFDDTGTTLSKHDINSPQVQDRITDLEQALMDRGVGEDRFEEIDAEAKERAAYYARADVSENFGAPLPDPADSGAVG